MERSSESAVLLRGTFFYSTDEVAQLLLDPEPLNASQLTSEQKLEDMIVRDPRILSSEWMLIGRQKLTSHGGKIDLLAFAPDASLVLIELMRDRTPREIIAQALDYATWVEHLTADKIAQIYQRFSSGGSLDEACPRQCQQCHGCAQLHVLGCWLGADVGRVF